MTVITERRQQLNFDNNWRAVKWDESPEFKGSYERALHELPGQGVKAADVVGVRRRSPTPPIILVGEFKDFDYPTIPPAQRQRVALQAVSDDLLSILVRKVIDTLSGASFAHDQQAARGRELRDLQRALGHARPSILVLFCVETPRTQSLAMLPWTKKLQQRLDWLGPNARVIVTSAQRPFDHLGVRYSINP